MQGVILGFTNSVINIILNVIKIPRQAPEVPLQEQLVQVLKVHTNPQSTEYELLQGQEAINILQRELGAIQQQLDERLQ
jgi:hypothetical protein